MNRARRLIFALTLAVLVAAGCSSGDGTTDVADPDPNATTSAPDPTAGEPGGTAEPDDTPVESTASARGITENTIRIGVAIPDLGAFTNAGDVVARYRAVADNLNANGGLIGREIELVVEQWDSLDPTGLDAACISLTEDTEVFVVLTRIPNALGDPSCFSDLGETITISGFGLEAPAVEASDGRLISTSADAFDAMLAGLPGLAGELADAKVALNGAAEPGEADRMEAIADALDDLGVDVVATTLSTVAYSDDPTESLSEQDTFSQVWVSEGATHVLAVNAAAIGAAEAIRNNGLADDLTLISGVIGIRTLTAVGTDISPLSIIGVSAPLRIDIGAAGLHGASECLQLMEDALGETPNFDPEPGEVNNVPTALEACDAFDFLTAAFSQTGPNPTQESFLAAIDAGFDFDMTSAGSARAGPDSAYLNRDAGAVYDWNGTEFVPRG